MRWTIEHDTRRTLILAIAIAFAGLFVGSGFAKSRSADRFVTVKGVAEREVRADMAIWPLSLVGADNDLAAANAKVAKSISGVRQFLVRHGIDTTQVELTNFSVSDAFANQYGPERQPAVITRNGRERVGVRRPLDLTAVSGPAAGPPP